MKRFALWAVVPACLVLGVLLFHGTALLKRTAPAICVEVGNNSAGGGDYLPAVDGYAPAGVGSDSSSDGGSLLWRVESSYKVAASSPGHFFVLAHYKIERNGRTTELDRALPVYDHRPDASQYSPLAGDLTAYAYVSNSTLNY